MSAIVKHAVMLAIGFALAFITVSCTSLPSGPGQNPGDGPRSGTGDASFLYIQYSEKGSLVLVGDGDPNHYTLTLNDVVPVTTYFSERPRRIAGTVSMENFLALPELFNDDDPPNAAVSAINTADGSQGAVILELRNPVYDAQLDNLFYDAIVIEGANVNGLDRWGRASGEVLPRNLENINVFIDHYRCPGVNPQCTD